MDKKEIDYEVNSELYEFSSGPPAKRKLVDSLRRLLEENDFNSITTAQIAKTAEANEALIYRYFGSKRGLLHSVLDEYLNEALINIYNDLRDIEDSVAKLKSLVYNTFVIYNHQRVFAKIILVEVRNFPDYFRSPTYQVVKRYARLYYDIIQEGINSGAMRSDIPPAYIRDAIIGALEHMIMPAVIFGKTIQPQAYTDKLCTIILNGILISR
ncbi:MAG: TetR/AcrR family transcriptional regulator [Desulfobacterales bacterium]